MGPHHCHARFIQRGPPVYSFCSCISGTVRAGWACVWTAVYARPWPLWGLAGFLHVWPPAPETSGCLVPSEPSGLDGESPGGTTLLDWGHAHPGAKELTSLPCGCLCDGVQNAEGSQPSPALVSPDEPSFGSSLRMGPSWPQVGELRVGAAARGTVFLGRPRIALPQR